MPASLVLAALVWAAPAAAQSGGAESVVGDLPGAAPRSALLFKSGQAWVQREAPVPAGATEVRIALPRSIHGTVWLESDQYRVERAVARLIERTVSRGAGEVADLAGVLRLALGHQATLELAWEERAEFVTGTVLRLLGPRHLPAGREIFPPPGPTHVALEVGGAVRVLPLARVQGVTLDQDLVGDWHDPRTEEVAALDVALRPAGGRGAHEGTLRMASFVDGLSWLPSYQLRLGDDDRAVMSGKAVLVNQLAEDLRGTQVRLVVGYPNVRFAGTPSPLHPAVSFPELAGLLGGQPQAKSMPVTMMQSRAGADAAYGEAAPPVLPDTATSHEDLYVYDMGRLDLAAGERAYLPLSRDELRFAHRYDWDVPDLIAQGRIPFRSDGDPEPPPVWHVLELHHDGKTPWTTAPVLVTGPQGPVAQSLLEYTPAGGEATVQLTRVPDVVTDASESVADEAQREAVTMFGRRYERVTIEARLELANRSGRELPMRVVKHLSGDVVSVEEDPEIASDDRGLGRINTTRTLTWEFDLAAGETWSANYRYRVLISR